MNPTNPTNPPVSRKKILVVDDDRVMLTFAGKLLEREGHEVKTAADGFEALNVLSDFIPDVIFFDLIMPKIDGDKLIQIIRSMPRLKESFLVIVSAVVAEVDFNFQATGADYYIAKGPFKAMAANIIAAIKASEAPRGRDIPKPVVGLEHASTRQLTRELLSRNRHLETILESMAEGILEVYSGRIVYANSAAIAMLGIPAQRLLTAHPPDLFEGSIRERLAALFATAPGQPAEIGESNPLEMNGRQLLAKKLPVKGDESTVMLMLTDITERKRLEMQLQHVQKMEAIGTIAAGVAHNFRNTLTEILVNSQLIQFSHKDEPPLLEITDRIHSSVKRGARLVDGLLHFSRKQISKEFKAVDLVRVIRETDQIIRHSFSAKVEIRTVLPDTLWIMGDSPGLSQVIMNLCTNARDAMPDGGLLTIEARREDARALVLVSDTGAGMDRETLEKCFDPFFTTKPIGKGTGLGLSTAYGIIKGHDGTISVESAPQAGATFRLQFPLAVPEESPPAAELRTLIHGRGQRILIVDDEAEINWAMQGLLNSLNYQPVRAENGQDALRLYSDLRPALVLLDLNMPGMDGLECARRILAIDPAAQIAILSGYGPYLPELTDLLKKRLLKGHLTKPVGITELSHFLAETLSPAAK
ncbi:MAG TPA: response regulator [Desulfobacterales bacterium]|nr:response regulator [Desulfobacterales bacterium]